MSYIVLICTFKTFKSPFKVAPNSNIYACLRIRHYKWHKKNRNTVANRGIQIVSGEGIKVN